MSEEEDNEILELPTTFKEEDYGIDLLSEKDHTSQSKKRPLPSELEIQSIVRPGSEATDNTSYYNLAALNVLLYAHVTQGVSVPALFAPDSITKVKFDF